MKSGLYPAWTVDRIEELRRLWKMGITAAEIAERLNVSRSAVLGKLDRLNVKRTKPPRNAEEKERARQANNARRNITQRIRRQKERGETIVEEKAAPPVFIGNLSVPFADLRRYSNSAPNQCRYIAAEPGAPEFLACGNETLPGESWCGHCRGIVYTKAPIISEDERERRARQGARNFSSAQVKSYGTPREQAA